MKNIKHISKIKDCKSQITVRLLAVRNSWKIKNPELSFPRAPSRNPFTVPAAYPIGVSSEGVLRIPLNTFLV